MTNKTTILLTECPHGAIVRFDDAVFAVHRGSRPVYVAGPGCASRPQPADAVELLTVLPELEG